MLPLVLETPCEGRDWTWEGVATLGDSEWGKGGEGLVREGKGGGRGKGRAGLWHVKTLMGVGQ